MGRFVFAILLLTTGFACAQPAFDTTKQLLQLKGIEINERILLDGKLKELCWQQAGCVSNFIQIEPEQNKPSGFRTEVRAVFNNQALYISFICYDSAGKTGYRSPNLKRDFEYLQNDMVAIAIDGFNDHRNSVTFATNAYGAQKDYLSFDDTYFDGDWNGLWNVRTSRTDSCWIAEFEIPWKTLRYSWNDSCQTMGLNLFRLCRNSNEISVWAPYPRSFGFNRMEFAGLLTGLKPSKPSANIQINPYFLAADSKTQSPIEQNVSSVKTGGEIKWAITPNMVFDASYNTDFAQADADLLVNNLSRFSVFFPEKRQFFLENASLFGVGIGPSNDLGMGGSMVLQPFFSRRIGLDDSGNPIPIKGGGRFVYRSAQRSFGAMYIHQKASETVPSAHYGVARYLQNIGQTGRVGSILVSKITSGSASKPGYTNTLGGVDGFFRLKNAHSITYMLLYSMNSLNHEKGYAGYMQYLYTTNKIKAWVTQSIVSNKFSAESGFLSRNNVIATTPGAELNIRGRWLPAFFREYIPSVYMEWYYQASDRHLQERLIKILPLHFSFSKGGFMGYSVTRSLQFLTADFSPIGILIPSGKYEHTRQKIFIASNASKKISTAAFYEWGGFYNGKLISKEASVLLAPVPYASVRLIASANDFENIGKDSTLTKVNLYTAEGRFALNPRLQLIGLFQKNSLNDLYSYNVRLSWEYRPLSYVYVVWNSLTASTDVARKQDQTGIIKLSYLKQF